MADSSAKLKKYSIYRRYFISPPVSILMWVKSMFFPLQCPDIMFADLSHHVLN